MKKEQKPQSVISQSALLLVVAMVAMNSARIAYALVPSKKASSDTYSVIGRAKKQRQSILEAIVTHSEDSNLLSFLPATSTKIKNQRNNGINSNNYHERRKRSRKHDETFSDSQKNSSTKAMVQNYKSQIMSPIGNDYPAMERLDTIPKLSDILKGSTSSKKLGKIHGTEFKGKQKFKIVNAEPKKKRNNEPNISNSGLKIRRKPDDNKNSDVENVTKPNQRAQLSSELSMQVMTPWRASYKSSKRTQGRIRKSFTESTSSVQGSHIRAQRVLDTLLNTPPKYCNVVNLVCALTYSAKAMGHHRVEKNLAFRESLQKTFDILYELLVVHRDEGLFTPRQLSNVAWAIAKHLDRDPDLLMPQEKNEALGCSDTLCSPESRLDETIDEIARQLTSILSNQKNNNSNTEAASVNKSKSLKKPIQQPKIKLGEICMACWAYGKLRPREIPPGWPGPPQMGAVKDSNAFVSGWRTEQLGMRQSFNSNIVNSGMDEDDSEKIESSVTDKLFDAIGLVLCRKDMEKDGSQIMLEDCTWSEIANVGWAFASHGSCQSTESEILLKSIAQEVSNRLRYGTIANNNSQQDFLVRDVTQLLWSLGTLQSDNFRLADDLVFLVESLTSNLRLGTKTRSSFAQGRPLRRWSCADLVQAAVALAHARIDENLLLQAIYEEGNHRLMEGATSNRKVSSLVALPPKNMNSKNELPIGEDRRTFHPWEASILLWSQARLFLTEKEGVVFDEFAEDAPLFFLKALRKSRGSFFEAKIRPQEQANIVWSLVILEKYDSPEAIMLIDLIFAEAARYCKENKSMQLEHAHQLWQAYFILQEDCPVAVKRTPKWFISYLKEKWALEKARVKLSSARHQSLSSTLQLMGIDHINEHDEDIDVAIILQPNAVWVHETVMGEADKFGAVNDKMNQMSVAVEFDGPNHFTRVRTDLQAQDRSQRTLLPPRALGHTVLKYRLLKKQGWTVVRVPYYEFDKIPFWASMERQRYLQRKLKTHANIHFSDLDVSEYKILTPNRRSRYD